jgi:hypothetical protein
MTERTKRQIKRMIGDFCREAAVLVAVFAPLDLVLRDRPVTTLYLVVTAAIVAAFMYTGIRLEIASDV